MPLSVALLFHFNQHFNEYARIASRACYCGLLRVLRSHPALRFNLHFSGTLIQALNWLDPEPLELVRAGLQAGQFELLGSTYAQNVLYASDDWDNMQQIALHRRTLQETFAVEPTVFWNAERCWRQSLAPLIAGGGYTTTLVEDHILRAAGVVDPYTFVTPGGPAPQSPALKIVVDDEAFRARFNFAAWFGRGAQLWRYLRAQVARPDAAKLCIAYAEAAEAMGLWGWERGFIPNQTWAYLDELLTGLENEPAIKLIKLSEASPPTAELPLIPDGSASWMDGSLQHPGWPYHEDGFSDWFDFNRRSPKLAHFRQTYAIIRSKMGVTVPDAPAAQRLYAAALQAYLAHQYEFGCIGIGGLNYRGWEDARMAVAIAHAAQLAEAPRELVSIEDCNGDGADEVLVSDGRQLIITSAYGGRLLYWFDLTTGQQFVGNQLPVLDGEYKGSEYSLPPARPARWLPGSDSPPEAGDWIAEPPPTRLGCYLPEWIWEGEAVPVKVASRVMETGGSELPLLAQTRAFCDYIQLAPDRAEEPPLEWLDSRLEKNGVTFVRYLSDVLTLEKSYRLAYNRMVVVSYTLRNHDSCEHSYRLRITHELTPDYDEVIRAGRGALAFCPGKGEAGGETPGVVNPRTQTSVTIQSSRAWPTMEKREDFCALTIGLACEVNLGARSEQKFEMKLVRGK